MNRNHHMGLCDRTVKNCIHDSAPNLFAMGKIYGSVLTIAFDDTFSFYAAAYNRYKHLQRANRPILSDKIHTPKSKAKIPNGNKEIISYY